MSTFRLAFYKGTRPGIPGIYNRLVRARGRGPYSHVEICFPDGWCASASFADKGVRFKQMELDGPNWDFIELPIEWMEEARQWFIVNQGCKYDVWGNVHLTVGFVSESGDKYFCSEAIAAALLISQPWRLEPNALYCVVQRIVSANARFVCIPPGNVR
jgi:hypothetical protein